MSDIRFNQWLHNSGTGGVSQVDGGHVGIGTTNPLIPVGSGNTAILNVGVVTANSFYGDASNLTGLNVAITAINNASNNRIVTSNGGTTVNSESNLTFDGSTLNNTNGGANFTKSANNYILVGSTNASGASLVLDGDSNGDGSGTDYAFLTHNTDGDLDIVVDNPANAGNIKFFTNSSTERLRITSDGDVAIGRDSALNNYAAGSTTTQLAVVKDGGAAGSGYHEVAHFTGGNDSDDTGAIVRITQFNNDRGLYIKGGRGSGNNAKAIFGLRNSSNVDNDLMSLLEGGQLVVNGDSNIGHPNMDDIIIGDASGSRGITIASGTSNYGSVAFGDSTDGSGADRYEGLIEYYHNDDSLTFYTAHTPKFKILSTSNGGALETASKTITGGNNLAIQNFKVKGVWSGASAIGKSIELISGYDSSVKMAAVGYNLTDVNTGSTYGGDLTFHTQPLYSSPTTPLPERMRISSSGYVTKPDTPCFIVRHGSAENYNAGSYIDGPWSVTLNRGNHFNTSNGIFTTPVAGLYQLNMMMNNDYGNTSNSGNFKIYVNNSLYAGMQFDPLDSHSGWFTHVLTGTLNLSRNDTVRLYTGNAARVDNSSWNHWSMYLVG